MILGKFYFGLLHNAVVATHTATCKSLFYVLHNSRHSLDTITPSEDGFVDWVIILPPLSFRNGFGFIHLPLCILGQRDCWARSRSSSRSVVFCALWIFDKTQSKRQTLHMQPGNKHFWFYCFIVGIGFDCQVPQLYVRIFSVDFWYDELEGEWENNFASHLTTASLILGCTVSRIMVPEIMLF
jgi:hypothetical protein